MAEGVEIPITAIGGTSAAAEILKPKRALDELGRSSETAASKAQKLSAGLGAFGGALGQIDPLLGQFGASVGRAGGAIGAMTSLIGGGPGIAFGGAVAVIGLLGSAIRDMVKESQTAARVLDEQAAASERLTVATNNLALARATHMSGVNALTREALERERETEAFFADRQAASYQAQQEDAARQIKAAEDVHFGGPRRSGGRGGGGRSSAPTLDDMMLSGGRDTSFLGNVGALDLGLSTDGDPRSLKGEGSSKGGGLAAFDTSDAADRSIDDAGRVQEAWNSAASSISDAMAGLVTDLITGGEVSTAAVMKGLGDQLVGMGVKDVFAGTARAISSYGADPSAWSLIAVGGAEIAAGVGMGAAGAAMGGGGGGGGGAGAGGGRPTPGAASDDNGGRDRGPTVINMYALNPTAETGRSIAKGLRTSERKSNRR